MPTHSDKRKYLAKVIGERYCGTSKLIPLDDFHQPSRAFLFDCFSDARICDAAWWGVGEKLTEAAADIGRVIDHAWLIGRGDPPREPWGLVTEPYIPSRCATQIKRKADKLMAGWGIDIQILSPDESTWNPGNCLPIVSIVEAHSYEAFIRLAMMEVLKPV
jgi:hypothetical protein